MLILYITTVAVATWFVYSNTKSGWSILVPLAMLITIDKFINYPIAVLGEFSAIALVFGSLLAWRKEKFFIAGLLAGAAVLSKFLMLLLLVSGIVCLGVNLLLNWGNKRPIIKHGLYYALGAGLSLGLWELYRFIQLGGSLHSYAHNIKQFIIYFRVNGSGLAANGTDLSLTQKANMILANYSLTKFALMVSFICLMWLAWCSRKELIGRAKAQMYGLGFIFLYASWWFFKSNGAYTRYVMPLAILGLGLIFCLVLDNKKHDLSYRLAAVILLITLCLGVWQNYFPITKPLYPLTLQQQQAIAKRVADYHPPNLAHVGWWQNSEILFLAGQHSRGDRTLESPSLWALSQHAT